jgi:hypothetical protein
VRNHHGRDHDGRSHDGRSHTFTLRRWATVTALLPVMLVAVAARAVADTDEGLTSSFGVAGPVGIVAVLAGIGGLVAGLLRRRRTEVARSEAQTAVIEKIVDPVRGESAA